MNHCRSCEGEDGASCHCIYEDREGAGEVIRTFDRRVSYVSEIDEVQGSDGSIWWTQDGSGDDIAGR